LNDTIMQNDIIRFFTYIERQPDGCLVFTVKDTNGYGHFPFRSRHVRASRFVWELFRGPIPEGHHIHHTCGNRACVNVAHLEALPGKEHRQHHRPLPWTRERDAARQRAKYDPARRRARHERAKQARKST